MKLLNNIIYWNTLNSNEQKNILLRPILKQKDIIKKTVNKIIKDVQNIGDQALIKYTLLFDQYKLNQFHISLDQILLSELEMNTDLKNAILIAKKNIELFHTAQILPKVDIETQKGIRCEQIYLPLNSIGIYIPGGSTALFSTVLMLAIPAKIAGCKEIILCSPPPISKEILYSAKLCGIQKIFQIGGAQAIAALSFGTNKIPKVDKIFGPGNIYVTEAKLQVSKMFNGPSIDMLAGPSELLIIADNTANPNFIAADLLSQAEHDISSQVFLVTPDVNLAKKIIISLNKQAKKLSRLNIIQNSLINSKIIITKNLDQCIEVSNIYAPEHLMIQTKTPRKILEKIYNASSIFLGSWSPESAGDYASGTNHVLPTYGNSIVQSALGLLDFQKRILIQEMTPKGFMGLSVTLEALSKAEKLDAHAHAVKIRVKEFKEII